MNEITNKNICLTLNSVWQPVGSKTVADAIGDLYCGNYKALDIQYQKNSDGSYNFDSPLDMTPLDWDQWLDVTIRSCDFYIRSAFLKIRVPTVLISQTYSKMPVSKMSLTPENIRKRDNNMCQYTGKKLKTTQGSIDHIVPKSKGGQDSWTNLVYCDKKLNTIKSNKSLQEANLKLIKTPKEPIGKPVCALYNIAQHNDWKHFII